MLASSQQQGEGLHYPPEQYPSTDASNTHTAPPHAPISAAPAPLDATNSTPADSLYAAPHPPNPASDPGHSHVHPEGHPAAHSDPGPSTSGPSLGHPPSLPQAATLSGDGGALEHPQGHLASGSQGRPRCVVPGCTKQPGFNMPRERQPLYCGWHK